MFNINNLFTEEYLSSGREGWTWKINQAIRKHIWNYHTEEYLLSRNLRKIKIKTFDNFIIKYIMSEWDVLLAIHNFSELKSLADNAKIRSLLKFLLIR